MQLRGLLVAACSVAGVVQPASAACILTSLNPIGTLGNPSENYTVMGSEAGGTAAGFTAVVTLGTNTVTVSAPTVSYTGASPHSGDQGQIKYRATDTLGFLVKQQDYTNQTTAFNVTSLLGTVSAVVNGKITNPTGFAQGTYQLKTVVTCS